jgi:hypothetical protein
MALDQSSRRSSFIRSWVDGRFYWKVFSIGRGYCGWLTTLPAGFDGSEVQLGEDGYSRGGDVLDGVVVTRLCLSDSEDGFFIAVVYLDILASKRQN